MSYRASLLCLVALSALPLAFAQSDYPRGGPPPPPPPPPPYDRVYEPLRDDRITVVYEETLGRPPSREELRQCHERSDRQRWTEDDLRNDIRRGREFREMTPDVVIQRYYRELLGHEPDAEGLRNYRRRMAEQHWTVGQVRQAILDSDEYQNHHVDSVIDHVYQETLERKPDAKGRDNYRKLIRQGMSEQELRDRLRQSEEYRVTLPDSKTRHAFHEILGHEPDAHSLVVYRKRLVDDGWNEDKIKDELRRTPEFQAKKNGKR